MKDFDTWNNLKKNIEERPNIPFSNKREIWWCSIGLNIGTEQDGKNELFERPVLILKVLNIYTVRVAPLTSQSKVNKYRIPISYNNMLGVVNISQLKTISTKRLSRKLTRLDEIQFKKVMQAIRKSL